MRQYTDSWGLLGTIEGAGINGSNSCYYTLLNQYCRIHGGLKMDLISENRHLLNCFWDKDNAVYVSHPDPRQNWGDGERFTIKELTVLLCFVFASGDLLHRRNLLNSMKRRLWIKFWGDKKLISVSNAITLLRQHWLFYPLLCILDLYLIGLALSKTDAQTAVVLHYNRIKRPTLWSILALKLYKFEPQEFMPKHTPPLEMPIKRLLRGTK